MVPSGGFACPLIIFTAQVAITLTEQESSQQRCAIYTIKPRRPTVEWKSDLDCVFLLKLDGKEGELQKRRSCLLG